MSGSSTDEPSEPEWDTGEPHESEWDPDTPYTPCERLATAAFGVVCLLPALWATGVVGLGKTREPSLGDPVALLAYGVVGFLIGLVASRGLAIIRWALTLKKSSWPTRCVVAAAYAAWIMLIPATEGLQLHTIRIVSLVL